MYEYNHHLMLSTLLSNKVNSGFITVGISCSSKETGKGVMIEAEKTAVEYDFLSVVRAVIMVTVLL